MGQLVFIHIHMHFSTTRGDEYTGDGTESPPFVMNQSSSILVPEFIQSLGDKRRLVVIFMLIYHNVHC
jgi:hypothetical protein